VTYSSLCRTPPSVGSPSLYRLTATTTTTSHMWYQLGLFGSRVVEEVCVSEDKSVSIHHVEAAVSAEEPEEDRAYGGTLGVKAAARRS
jgi:hypothetical protein